MKKYIFLLLVACLAFIRCDEDFDANFGGRPMLTPRYLSVSPWSMSFLAEEKIPQTLYVQSVHTPWTIDNTISWAHVDTYSGSSDSNISVNVDNNPVGDVARIGVFYVKSTMDGWNFEQPVSVTQSGAKPSISLSEKNFSLDGRSQKISVIVTANCDWTITSSSNTWYTYSTKDNVITISVSANESSEYRNGTIYVTHKGNFQETVSISVSQRPASISASSEKILFANTAGAVTIQIDSESTWTASTSSSWIELSAESGKAGISTLTINVSPNMSTNGRQGYVILYVGQSQCIQIPVSQQGIYLDTSDKKITFDAVGSSTDIQVESNTEWVIYSKPDWIEISQTEGEGDCTLKITALENPNTAQREGYIILTHDGINLEAKIFITQKGKTFDIATTVLDFTDKASSQSLQILTDGTWIAESSENWISISPSTSSGNSTLTVSVSENTNEGERIGNINVVMGDKSIAVAVVQQGKYFTVDNSLITFTSLGGQMQISITSNGEWCAYTDAAWLNISKTEGNGDINLSVSATNNRSTQSRSASIIFSTPYGRNIQIIVNQDAKYISLDTSKLLFYPTSATSDPITITTDGNYTISSTQSWLIITQTANTFTVTVSDNNDKDVRYGKVIVSLVDLDDCTYSISLDVIQLNKGGSFMLNGYDSSVNWDNSDVPYGTINVKQFNEDNNYDAQSQANYGASLSIVKYHSDKGLDDSSYSELLINTSEYDSEINLDSNSSSCGNVSRTDYEEDNNWN